MLFFLCGSEHSHKILRLIGENKQLKKAENVDLSNMDADDAHVV